MLRYHKGCLITLSSDVARVSQVHLRRGSVPPLRALLPRRGRGGPLPREVLVARPCLRGAVPAADAGPVACELQRCRLCCGALLALGSVLLFPWLYQRSCPCAALLLCWTACRCSQKHSEATRSGPLVQRAQHKRPLRTQVVYTDLKAAAGLPSFVVTIFVVSWVWLGAFVFRNIFVGTIVHGDASPRSTLECCPSSSVLRIRSTEPLVPAIDSSPPIPSRLR